MSKVAFLFPGQGSQRVGMGKELCEQRPDIREQYFKRADEILGFHLSTHCFEGPEEELVKTEVQQPAIFLVSVACLKLLVERGIQAEAVAGHSLGEYSALVAADAFDFETGLRLTRRRGELMAEVAQRTGGRMEAILGLSIDKIQQACEEASEFGVVEVANFNSPAQTVISGAEAAVERAAVLAQDLGAQRVVRLNVSAPFHCSLMSGLSSAFQPELEKARVQDAKVPVVANMTAHYERSPGEIRENLVKQLSSAVRWTESINLLLADGFDTFLEVGPGRVLTGLLRSTDRSVTALNVSDVTSADRVLALLEGSPAS